MSNMNLNVIIFLLGIFFAIPVSGESNQSNGYVFALPIKWPAQNEVDSRATEPVEKTPDYNKPLNPVPGNGIMLGNSTKRVPSSLARSTTALQVPETKNKPDSELTRGAIAEPKNASDGEGFSLPSGKTSGSGLNAFSVAKKRRQSTKIILQCQSGGCDESKDQNESQEQTPEFTAPPINPNQKKSVIQGRISKISGEKTGETEIPANARVSDKNNPIGYGSDYAQPELIPLAAVESAVKKAGLQAMENVSIQKVAGQEKTFYVAEGQKQVKLLGMIPIEMKVKVAVDTGTAEVVSVEKPWWSVFVAD